MLQKLYYIVKAVLHLQLAPCSAVREWKISIFPTKSRMRQGSPIPPLLFNIVQGHQLRLMRQEEEIKDIYIRKETVNDLHSQITWFSNPGNQWKSY